MEGQYSKRRSVISHTNSIVWKYETKHIRGITLVDLSKVSLLKVKQIQVSEILL